MPILQSRSGSVNQLNPILDTHFRASRSGHGEELGSNTTRFARVMAAERDEARGERPEAWHRHDAGSSTLRIARCGATPKGQGDISRMAALLDCPIAPLSGALAPCPARNLPLSRVQTWPCSTLGASRARVCKGYKRVFFCRIFWLLSGGRRGRRAGIALGTVDAIEKQAG